MNSRPSDRDTDRRRRDDQFRSPPARSEGALGAPASCEEPIPRKIGEADRAKLPLNSSPKAAQDISRRDRLLTAPEAASLLRLSASWLAKSRMRGDGPPYVKLGGSIRYLESTLFQWMKLHQRLSTSER